MQTFELKFSGVTILQGVEFPVFLLILSWALQQCSATALPVIQLPHQCYRLSKISCLCLFDLSAEFDTIDHNILLSRLSSWFGITGTVIDYSSNIICSLFLSMLNMKVVSRFSSIHTFFCDIPQGPVLDLFTLSCTPPLSVH